MWQTAAVATGRLASGAGLAEPLGRRIGNASQRKRIDVSEPPAWKRVLQEPNAIGWIAFFFVVAAIGFGSLYFGSPGPAKPDIQHAAK